MRTEKHQTRLKWLGIKCWDRTKADCATEKNCIEKWDSRGTWHEDGPAGAYVSYTKYMLR